MIDTEGMVPQPLLDATRSLLHLTTTAEAIRITTALVQGLGGSVVSADVADADCIPADLSFGEGPPQVASAPVGSEARRLLDRYLPAFLLDVRQALELGDRVGRLAESASTDVLTGLPNRRMLERSLGRLVKSEVVIMLDLDNFKAVNDDFGHAVGDAVLSAFGAALRATVRGRDTVGRYGGEEFVVVLPASADPEAFLTRLHEHWTAVRPYPTTFSAGIALMELDVAEVMARADEALYRAKASGRDRWLWAQAARPNSAYRPSQMFDAYLGHALRGDKAAGVRLTLDLLDHHVPYDQIIADLLAAAQREIGERWQRNEITAVDEHLASGVAAAALDALANETSSTDARGLTVVTCAQGDWHSLAAQMFGETLRVQGFGVRVLGASTPVEAVADFLNRSSCDAFAVSCSIPIYFPGVVRLIALAHARGIPVMVGGRAFGVDARRALNLGADAWALSAHDAAPILTAWQAAPPPINPEPQPLDAEAALLFGCAEELGSSVLQSLVRLYSAISNSSEALITSAREDLVYIVQFIAAALAADDDTVFLEFILWLKQLLGLRGVPASALTAGLDVLRREIGRLSQRAERLLEVGRESLLVQ